MDEQRSNAEESSAEKMCRTIYDEVAAYYARTKPRIDAAELGYRILYGPPLVNPEICFVGYQPGGGVAGFEDGQRVGHHEGWPSVCDYAVAPWPLAKRMRAIWGVPALERSTGLNVIFFRAPSAKAWQRVPTTFRKDMEEFSRSRAERIVRALSPRHIVVVGLGTFDRLAKGSVELKAGERALVKRGELWGIPAWGVIHLSGARLNRDELQLIGTYFAE